MDEIQDYQDYKLIIAKGSDKLSEKVRAELEDGYIPFGSPVISNTVLSGEGDDLKMLTLVGQAVVLPYEG